MIVWRLDIYQIIFGQNRYLPIYYFFIKKDLIEFEAPKKTNARKQTLSKLTFRASTQSTLESGIDVAPEINVAPILKFFASEL